MNLSKKALAITAAISIMTAMGAVAYADSTLKQITAYQNSALNVTVNGSAVDLSSEEGVMYPIVYEGHSYVSAKAVAEALGAKVSWNSSTKTVEITDNGNVPADRGNPNKDTSDSGSIESGDASPSSPSPKPAPTPTSTPTSTPAPVSTGSTAVFASKLSKDFSKDKVASANKQQALNFIKAYAYAIKTGNTDRVDSYVDSVILKVPADSYRHDAAYNKEDLHKRIKSTRDANKEAMLEKWANVIDAMTANDVIIKYTSKLDSVAGFEYWVTPAGFDAFSQLSVTFNFSIPYQGDQYLMETIWVN